MIEPKRSQLRTYTDYSMEISRQLPTTSVRKSTQLFDASRQLPSQVTSPHHHPGFPHNSILVIPICRISEQSRSVRDLCLILSEGSSDPRKERQAPVASWRIIPQSSCPRSPPDDPQFVRDFSANNTIRQIHKT